MMQAMQELSAAEVEQFRMQGFVVLRGAFDPAPLTDEVGAALTDGFARRGPTNVSAEATIAFRYVPMMSERTPQSLDLLDTFAAVAERLLGAAVLPVRAKAVEYHGASTWHRDTELGVATVGFACYLEPLTAQGGALRVVPGSHRHTEPAAGPGVAVETAPGDVIVLDEHLVHASEGGSVRRQWRVDYITRPTDAEERELVREYFAAMFQPGWDGGYDLDTFPTYGEHWRSRCDPEVDATLSAVGAYTAAAAEEDAARAARAGDG
jgi:hypothetical protein